MTLNSAYALCPALTVMEYNENRQTELLRQIGEWAMQYSSIVSLHPPDHLLIEIAGSRRLFESYKILITLICEGLSKLGFKAQTGVAPTPLAANLLARANHHSAITCKETLKDNLKNLSIALLDVDDHIKELSLIHI